MLCCAKSLSHVWPFATLWTVAHQALLSMGILQARILEWVAMPSSRGSSQPRDWTQASHIAGGVFNWLSHQGILGWVAYPFSRESSWPTNWTGVSCLAGGFFTSWATREARSIYNLCRGCPGGAMQEVQRCEFNPWAGKIPWGRKWQRIPVFLPEKFHGQRCLVAYIPWGHKGIDTTEQLST